MLDFSGAARRAVVLDHVTKVTAESEPHLIFGSMCAVLPVDRVVTVLGRQGAGKTTLLSILAGVEPVDGGRIRGRVKFSMVLNGRGYLYPAVSGMENAEMLARIFAMPPKRLVELAMSLPGVSQESWLEPIGALLPRDRRSIEILLAGLLPFDCFLLDDIDRADQNILAGFIRLITARKAGLICTTFAPRMARQFGEAGAVIAGRGLHVFDTVKEAIAHYG